MTAQNTPAIVTEPDAPVWDQNHVYVGVPGSLSIGPVRARKGTKSDPDAEPRAAYKFPLTRKGASLLRYLMDDDTLAAYLAETDADKRAAILAGLDTEPVEVNSAVHPTLAQWTTMLARLTAETEGTESTPKSVLAARVADAVVILPRKARASKGSADAAAVTAAALDSIFG